MRKIVFTIICLLLVIPNVKAEINSNYIKTMSPEGYNIQAEAKPKEEGYKLSMNLITPNEDNNQTYYILFIKDNNEQAPNLNNYKQETTLDDCRLAANTKVGELNYYNNETKEIEINNDWFLLNNYEYAYIIKSEKVNDKYECTITTEPININHPNLPTITERYQIIINKSKELKIYPHFPYLVSKEERRTGEHKLITKIGLIKDNELLVNIKKSKTNSYLELIKYAKEDKEGKTWELNDYDENNTISLTDYQVENKEFYYIYTTYSESDTTYRNLDGINILEAKNNTLTTNVDVKNIINKKDELIKNTIIPILLFLILILIITIIILKPNKKETKK